MLHKGLWFQNYKQSKYILLAFWLTAVLSGVQFYNHAGNVASHLQFYMEIGKNHQDEYQYNFYANVEMISAIQLLLCVGLAAVLVGLGRTNQTLELAYAMPVKREYIFLTKWLLGVVHIIGATTAGFLIQLAVIHTTVLSTFLPDRLMGIYYLHQLFTLCAVFSLSLWIGFVGGNVISQIAFCIILPLVPYGLYGCMKGLVSMHYFAMGIMSTREDWLFLREMSLLFEHISFPIKLLNVNSLFALANFTAGNDESYLREVRQLYLGVHSFIVPVLVTAASVWGMQRMARTSRNENNGKLLLNERLRPYLVAGGMVCVFLFGGTLLEGMLGDHYYGREGQHAQKYVQNLIIFYTSGAVSAAVAAFIVRKWLGGKGLPGRRRTSAG
ncbi:hypothetical protein [Paenibacillus sp. OAS669]|uniref:hypothetical protein n=1 Tax=Paenibacillus sp. OAS669 TaxID=2663821 RepID=UPI00178AEBDD|nr:hypothetical protein [Paenibacillus sp. OAS669]MBE1446690.1 ABC-type transport system involved in multi-copper enzyme maturation permease subunit [Paenibacillus sp. OAS669]